MALKARMKILIVDPVRNMSNATRQMLSQVGLKNIKEASDAEKAIEIMEEGYKDGEPVEFIIMEWDLPKMSGLELITHIRSQDISEKLPILVLTGSAEQQVIIESVQAGANNFCVKPFSSSKLQEKIGAIFKQSNKNKKKAA